MSSLSKLLSVLDLFGPATLRIDPDTIAERMGLSRATAYRYVKDLCDAGLLTRVDAGSYGLGPRVIELDWMMRQYDPILLAGRELMHELSAQTGLAVFASVFMTGASSIPTSPNPPIPTTSPSGAGTRCRFSRGAIQGIDRLSEGPTPATPVRRTHGRRPGQPYDWASFAKATKKIRKDGYCLTHDELNLGLTGIAAPIIQPDIDEVIGSLSAVGSTQSFKLLRQETVIEMVMDTTRRIAENMRNHPRTAAP